MTYLTNAFSINMLAREGRAIRFEPVSVERAAELARDMLVAQYSGPRLPEGATALPAGARIEFWLVHDA